MNSVSLVGLVAHDCNSKEDLCPGILYALLKLSLIVPVVKKNGILLIT